MNCATTISKKLKRYFHLITFFALLLLYSCNQNNKIKEKSSDLRTKRVSLSSANIQEHVLIAKEIVKNQKSRVSDGYGSGQYGSSRDQGTRTHKGIDIIVKSGEKIYSPITGNIVRQTMPYGNDPSYKGIVLKGTDKWVGYELKIFYVEGLFSGGAVELQEIGIAQDLTLKYPKITNHIHLEVKYQGNQIDPFILWQYSF